MWRLVFVWLAILATGTLVVSGKSAVFGQGDRALLQKKSKSKEKPKTPLSEARERWLRGNFDEAMEQYQKLLDEPNSKVAATIGIARVQQSQGDYPQARETIQKLLKEEAFANRPELMAVSAEFLYLSGQWEPALQTAEATINLKKDSFLARWVKAQILRDKGDWTAANAELLWFIRTYSARSQADNDITDPDELLLVGQAGTLRANWFNLTDQFRFILNEVYADVLQFDPDCWQAEYLAGAMLLEKYNRPDAVNAFDKALKINPKAAEALVGKGEAALQGLELKQANSFADQALKINPRLPMALRLKADVHLASGELSEAKKVLQQALEVNPREELTLGRFAACCFVLKQEAEVNKLIAEVQKFNPKPAQFYHELASCLEDRRLYPDAEKFFLKSIELRDKLSAPRAGLGMLYLRLGRETEAKTLLTKAFENDKFNVRVANSLKVLRHLEKYETIQTKHYDLRFDPKRDRVLAEFVAEYLEQVHDELVKQFNHEPKQRFLFELFTSHEMFSGRTVALPDLHTIGACTGRVVTMASPRADGISKPFNWGRVIRHEVVHLFNLDQTEFRVPHWLTEGLAVRNEQMTRPPMWSLVLRERFESKTLLTLENIQLAFSRPKSQEEWTLAYCQSQLYVDFLSETYGKEAIGKILDAYRSGVDDGGAIQKACGVDKAEFEKGYLKFVEKVVQSIPQGSRKTEKAMTLEELEKQVKDQPDDLDAAARLSDQYLRRKKVAEARKLAEEVLKKKATHPVASMVKARLLTNAGDDEAARTVLETAQKDNPDDHRLIVLLSRIYLDTKEYNSAVKLLEHARKVAPLEGNWNELLEKLYTDLKETDKLIAILQEIASLDADDLATRVKLAQQLLEAKKFAEAERAAHEALEIDVLDKTARKVYLQALKEQGKETDKIEKRFVE
jgi:tetratricopeptide (TPR) repeat protein